MGTIAAILLALATVAGAAYYLYTANIATIPNTWTNPEPLVTLTPEPAPTPTPPVTSTPLEAAPVPTPTPPPIATDKQGMTFLLIGTDDRSTPANAELGGFSDSSARSDTIMLVRLHPGWHEADLVSIPRDTIVNIKNSPACRRAIPQTRINAAYTVGGPSCSAEQVAQLTGQPIDHVITVDFSSTVSVIDTLGGLNVCLATPINDPDSASYLPAGNQTLTGEETLELLRVRKTLGNGSDLDRTTRQRHIVSLLQQQVANRARQDPAFLPRVSPTVISSVQTDKNLSLATLTRLVQSLSTTPPALTTSQLPVAPNPLNPNTVVYTPTTGTLFSDWNNDTHLRSTSPLAQQSPPPPPSTSTTPTPPAPFCA